MKHAFDPMTPRERAYTHHAECMIQHAQAKLFARASPTLDNLTALNLAAHNLACAEQDLIDWFT